MEGFNVIIGTLISVVGISIIYSVAATPGDQTMLAFLGGGLVGLGVVWGRGE